MIAHYHFLLGGQLWRACRLMGCSRHSLFSDSRFSKHNMLEISITFKCWSSLSCCQYNPRADSVPNSRWLAPKTAGTLRDSVHQQDLTDRVLKAQLQPQFWSTTQEPGATQAVNTDTADQCGSHSSQKPLSPIVPVATSASCPPVQGSSL